jgi:putative chitinase
MSLETKLTANVFEQVELIKDKYYLDPLCMAHFLAQCSHESGDFKHRTENLNYSEQGLLKTFPKYFNVDTAKIYARNPEKIGSKVYANRMGNGDEKSGEGYKFRGRGYIQLTGKDNYKLFGNFIAQDMIANPEAVANLYPLESAYWFFTINNLWDIAKQGDSEKVIKKLTLQINGGIFGLQDRITKFNFFYHYL